MNTPDSYKLNAPTPLKTWRSGVSRAKFRPKRIFIKFSDPFDDTLLATANMEYDPRKAARGFYTKYVDKMKKLLSQIHSAILEDRTAAVGIIYEN